MIISVKYGFIFIHVYKNAGTSINAALEPFLFYNKTHMLYYKICKRFKIHLPLILDPHPLPEHCSMIDVVNFLGPERKKRFFSFAFVRNPWDWQVSLYTFMRRTAQHKQHLMLSRYDTFEDYIRWRCSEDVHFQKDFVYAPDGTQLVDFIGRYEHIDRDFRMVCDRINIQASLPMLNVSKERPYQDYYIPETVELVRRTFLPDIELFDYKF
jgi:hypothetical protein